MIITIIIIIVIMITIIIIIITIMMIIMIIVPYNSLTFWRPGVQILHKTFVRPF